MGDAICELRNCVPAEFVGLARLFRQSVLAADQHFNSALQAIAGRLQRRLTGKPSFRQDLIEGTVRMWRERTSNPPCAIVRNVRLGKESLILTAVRLTASTWRDDAWVHPGWKRAYC